MADYSTNIQWAIKTSGAHSLFQFTVAAGIGTISRMEHPRFWSTLEANLFRLSGALLGIGGCLALLANNPLPKLFANAYGLFFLAVFTVMGIYSTVVLIRDLLAPPSA